MAKGLKKSATSSNNDEGLTVGLHLVHLIPRLDSDHSAPAWPADVFALVASLLLKSGAYIAVLSDWPPIAPKRRSVGRWAREMEDLGRQWRQDWVKDEKAPKQVQSWWQQLMDKQTLPLSRISKDVYLCQTLLQLCAAADEASQDVGSPEFRSAHEVDQRFKNHADSLLQNFDRGSSLCIEIDPSRMRVLPKMHTPQSGLTLRSLSLYLCLCASDEVRPKWVLGSTYARRETMNLLVIPWPYTITPAQFRAVPGLKSEMRNMPADFGFFTFDHHKGEKTALQAVTEMYNRALVETGQIDGVVLPELALTDEEHECVRDFVVAKGAFLVAGVGACSEASKSHGKNQVCLDLPFVESMFQSKHHRWRLDSTQLDQYSLGARLSPEKKHWEHIDVADRQLLFASLHPALVLCVLICEDLARPDPVGDLVRAVGPNLVIALLMDAPQLRSRWPGRYAMALADDPGSSVLSVTTLGMSALSRPSEGPNRSRVIALWKDPLKSEAREIELPADCGGVVLSLSVQYRQEWTVDGRDDNYGAGVPVLCGQWPVRLS